MVRNNPFNIQLPGLSENRVPQDLMDYQFIQLAAIFFIQVYGCLSIPTTSRVFCMGQPQVGPGKRGQLSQPKIIQVVDCWGTHGEMGPIFEKYPIFPWLCVLHPHLYLTLPLKSLNTS